MTVGGGSVPSTDIVTMGVALVGEGVMDGKGVRLGGKVFVGWGVSVGMGVLGILGAVAVSSKEVICSSAWTVCAARVSTSPGAGDSSRGVMTTTSHALSKRSEIKKSAESEVLQILIGQNPFV